MIISSILPINTLREFLRLESASGIILVAAAILALIIYNTPLAGFYDALLNIPVEIKVGPLYIAKPMLLWINDGLMAIFFMLIGLEVKREIVDGQLSSISQVALPGIAALGGMAVPALIYVWLNLGNEVALGGWAIPAATDIAFALGILALLGSRVPVSLKLFLLALAIMDDLGAIVIIAIFFTSDLSFLSLGLAVLSIVVLCLLNKFGITRIAAYVVVGVILWICVLKSGVHATLAGVALAFAIPLRAQNEQGESPLRTCEHALHPWVAYGIMPIFAFANAGVSLGGLSLTTLLDSVPLGVAVGLFVGKQIGIFGFTFIGVKIGLTKLPDDIKWLGLYGLSALCGIGFTMSFFIASLAFAGEGYDYATTARIGILLGSFLSAVVGYVILHYSLKETADLSK